MNPTMNKQEKIEFTTFVRQCTDEQLLDVIDKERQAGRMDHVVVAKQEKIARESD